MSAVASVYSSWQAIPSRPPINTSWTNVQKRSLLSLWGSQFLPTYIVKSLPPGPHGQLPGPPCRRGLTLPAWPVPSPPPLGEALSPQKLPYLQRPHRPADLLPRMRPGMCLHHMYSAQPGFHPGNCPHNPPLLLPHGHGGPSLDGAKPKPWQHIPAVPMSCMLVVLATKVRPVFLGTLRSAGQCSWEQGAHSEGESSLCPGRAVLLCPPLSRHGAI